MFDKTDKETKTISLEEITLQDVDIRVGTQYIIDEISWIISVSAQDMIVRNSVCIQAPSQSVLGTCHENKWL